MAVFRRYVDAELLSLSWHRRIAIEKRRWEQRESTSQPPPSARNVQEHREPYLVDHTQWLTEKQYVNGQEQTVRRQVTKQTMKIRKVYTYEVPAWHTARVVPASGDGQSRVRWPEYTLADGEREGQRTELYAARFTASPGRNGAQKEYAVELAETEWRSLQIGATYRLDIGIFGTVRGLDRNARRAGPVQNPR